MSLMAITSILNQEVREESSGNSTNRKKKMEKNSNAAVHCTNLQSAMDAYFKNVIAESMKRACSSPTPQPKIEHKEVKDEVNRVLDEEEQKQMLKNLSSNDLLVIQKINKFHKRERARCIKSLQARVDEAQDIDEVIFEAQEKLARSRINTNPECFRGSKYRGVSVNGKTWQVFVVIRKVKRYAG